MAGHWFHGESCPTAHSLLLLRPNLPSLQPSQRAPSALLSLVDGIGTRIGMFHLVGYVLDRFVLLHPQSPQPATQPASSSSVASRSSTKCAKIWQCSTNTQARMCLQTGISVPRVTPPNMTFAPPSEVGRSPVSGAEIDAGNAAKVKAGHEQLHAFRRTS